MSGHSAYPSHGRNDYPRGKAPGQAKPLASKKAKVGTTTLPLQQIHCSKTIAEFRQDDCVNAVALGTVGDDAPADQRDYSAREFREAGLVQRVEKWQFPHDLVRENELDWKAGS
jgi:hypothetical protein